jgi:hypothetical protein
MDIAAAIVVVLLLVLLPAVIVGGMFVWAALRDGEEDRALQARLGIRRLFVGDGCCVARTLVQPPVGVAE